ncbi:uncharacterized protein LOC123443455 [Hordeum vulgare subsp. vulgare]|uniref:uncharacterized protein LOC123443455 n=1 Tax=Hordeum vulgare subsp. vulgare TaxID=112509 RepID=UPI001D1A4D3C|nr:uncharacterized protein LOC123443455 [Hordeum vulgare subsp. vulgare]
MPTTSARQPLRPRPVMDEMAYSINGENAHYGTPDNPCAPGHVPGGSAPPTVWSPPRTSSPWRRCSTLLVSSDVATLYRVSDVLLPPVSTNTADAELRQPSRVMIQRTTTCCLATDVAERLNT